VYGGHEHAARQTVLALTAGRRKAVPATCWSFRAPGTRWRRSRIRWSC